jgi:hypothetical protein
MDPIVPKLLEPFNVRLHHFTPNGIAALAKFLWVVRTFGGVVSVDAFCRLFELHCQPSKVYVDDDTELSEVQNGCCTFVPRKPNKKTGLQKVMLFTAQKNKSEGNRLGYWFYAKIGFSDPEGSNEEKYLLASDIDEFDHTYQPAYNKRAPGFKPCLEAFMVACHICSGRDVVEEFLAAKVYPLSAGWAPRGFERKQFAGLDYDELSPVFGLQRLEGISDEIIVAGLEREASEILGPWNKKEYASLVEICGKNHRLNRCLAEMGVAYDLRPVPPERHPEDEAPGNVGSEVPVLKSKGKDKVEEVGSSGAAGGGCG